MSDKPVYELVGVAREFAGPTEQLEVLSRIDLTVEAGESIAILGASGSGKTTLLHILGTLEKASRGEVRFGGKDLEKLDAGARARMRNTSIGFVFQFHHLLPEFTTLENAAMPALVGGMRRDRAEERAREALGLVGLEHRVEHKVTTLSGGERQRAAIARAILLRPRVLLADEPTGNLDEKTGRRIQDLLVELNETLGMTFVVVTHNADLAAAMQRRLELRSGELYAVH